LAAPINQSDLFIFKNIHFFQKPKRCIPGLEGAGIVVENGGGLLGWGMLNKKVAFITQTGFTGSYGQYVIASTSQVVPIPSVFLINI
jgi:NADPH:quinone reductase-like Zn-dependent oxidoreductase